GPYALWVMRPDGTSPRKAGEALDQCQWLPDSKRILAISRGGLAQVDLATGIVTPVAGARGRTVFSVDSTGRWVAYQASAAGPMSLEAIALLGGSPRPVATGGYEAYHPFFSPSGRWLYFQPDHKNLYRVPGPEQEWKTAPPEKVTDFSGPDLYIEDPRISRDG